MANYVPTRKENMAAIMAGVEQFNEAFGFYGTLDSIAQHTKSHEDELLKWSYRRFYTKVGYLSHLNKLNKDLANAYREIK